MLRNAATAVMLAAIVTIVPATAQAQGQDLDTDRPSKVEWNPSWPKFRWWEYGVATVGWGATIGSGYVLPDTPYGWKGRNDFDESVRDGLRWSGASARIGAATASDAIFYGLAAFPIVVDDLIVTWGIHKKGDVAWQLLMTDIESLGVAGLFSSITERTGRERPYVRTCASANASGTTGAERSDSLGNQSPQCDEPGRNQSFISGHTAAAFAGAGLICVHHEALPLFGARAADITTCALAMGGATFAGYLRIAADMHYASDVLAATGVGLTSGLLLPYLLRFGFGGTRAKQFTFAPMGTGVSMTGVLP